MNLKLLVAGALAAMALAPAANAATVTWAVWNDPTATGTNGVVTGTAGTLGITYNGYLETLDRTEDNIFNPASSWEGGNVSNAPIQSNGVLRLQTGSAQVKTITFSSSVNDPLIALWSVGANGTPASFAFTSKEDPTIVAGGPNAPYGGATIFLDSTAATPLDGGSPFAIDGIEGNGVIELQGTFKSITFVTPQSENWYGFTVGYVSPAPEPASWGLMIVGLGLAGGAMRMNRRRAAVVA